MKAAVTDEQMVDSMVALMAEPMAALSGLSMVES